MKSRWAICLSGFLLFFAVEQGMAQKKSPIRPPKQVVDSFHKFYPYTKKPVWSKTSVDTFEARFPWQGSTALLILDKKGNWLQRKMEVGRNEMPVSIINFVDQNFPGSMPDAVYVTYLPDAKSTFYELKIVGRVFHFNDHGKLMEEVEVR